MLPTIVLLPLMALAVALPFIGARRLHLLLGLALVWVIAIGVIGSVAPPPADPAPWYGKAFQVVTMATATFLTSSSSRATAHDSCWRPTGSERCP
jgi:hypothetical protein